MSDLTTALSKISGQSLFISLSPDVADFTSDQSATLQIRTLQYKIDVPIPSNKDGLFEADILLRSFLCDVKGEPLIIGWNLKNFYSYFLGRTGQKFALSGNVFDLQVLESYEGIQKPRPDTFLDAAKRFSAVTEHKSWNDLKNVYSSIYKSLLTTVIPEIEVLGISHKASRQKLHSHYEIASQLNGRMKCSKAYKRSFNPHSLMPDDKEYLRPPFVDDYVFMYLDYRNMEVNVLQWLSGDPVLKSVLDSGDDVYCSIWKILTGMDCNDDFRGKCKALFLPVMFGQGVDSVAERLNLGNKTAGKLVNAVYTKFSVAANWIKRRQDEASNGCAVDILGRCRNFGEHELYKIRNFSVQSPAALFCLDRLILLHSAIKKVAKIGFHIHDGYVLFVKREDQKEASRLAIAALESESEFFPNLALKVACHVGDVFNF